MCSSVCLYAFIMEGLVSCIAGQHFFLKGFNLVFGLLVAPVN